MNIKTQTLAYLTDGTTVFEQRTYASKKAAEEDVERMNVTAQSATDGNILWTLEAPQQEGAA